MLLPEIQSATSKIYRIPLKEPLEDAKHGKHTHFELITFTIKLNNPINNQDIWYNIACNSLSSMDNVIQTDLTYSNTSTTLHYLPTSYLSDVNTTTPYNAGALFLTNAANSSKYIITKIHCDFKFHFIFMLSFFNRSGIL